MVGDSWTADILGALAAGMSVVHVDRDNTAAGMPLPPGPDECRTRATY
ncbi:MULTISPECIES: HAD hydrolase-like protein [Nocardia]